MSGRRAENKMIAIDELIQIGDANGFRQEIIEWIQKNVVIVESRHEATVEQMAEYGGSNVLRAAKDKMKDALFFVAKPDGKWKKASDGRSIYTITATSLVNAGNKNEVMQKL